jgi:hypothetical protein
MVDKQEGDLFTEFLKGLDIALPLNGLKPPEIEAIDDDTEELDGNVLKITFELNLFMNHRKDRYFMVTSNQKMQHLGSMSLKEAIAKFNPSTKRKRR